MRGGLGVPNRMIPCGKKLSFQKILIPNLPDVAHAIPCCIEQGIGIKRPWVGA